MRTYAIAIAAAALFAFPASAFSQGIEFGPGGVRMSRPTTRAGLPPGSNVGNCGEHVSTRGS